MNKRNNQEIEDDLDVIICGAGISGLSAAYHFRQNNPKLRFLVLEGRDRIGGRVFTFQLKGRMGHLEI